jgi:molecular chaperone GrpE
MSDEAKDGAVDLGTHLERLRSEAEAHRAKAEEYLDLARRTRADFVNYQDRVKRDKQTWDREAVERFVRELLPALDGFAMARFDDPKLLDAMRVLEKEFLRVLAKFGIVPIDLAGKSFDPAFHEAVGAEEGGTALEEARRGWMLGDRVLRPASVRVVKPKA